MVLFLDLFLFTFRIKIKLNIFFCDRHGNLDNDSKSLPEIKFNRIINGKLTVYNYGYWDISALLSEIFLEQNLQDREVDFFMEVPYGKNQNFYECDSSNYGYLGEILNNFVNNFNKRSNDFYNVRFNYFDIRVYLSEIGNKPWIVGYYIYNHLNKIINFSFNEIKNLDPNNLDIINIVIKELFMFHEGKNDLICKYEKYINLCLHSDSFVKDVNNLFSDMFELISHIDPIESKKIQDSLLPHFAVVQNNDKCYHLIRKEYLALFKQDYDLADNIIIFLKNKKIMKHFDISKVLENWNFILNLCQKVKSDEIKSDEYENIIEDNIKPTNYYNLFYYYIGGFYVDFYSMFRLFRKFSANEKTTKESLCLVHIENYNEFISKYYNIKFTVYGQNDITESGSKDYRLVDVNINDFIDRELFDILNS